MAKFLVHEKFFHALQQVHTAGGGTWNPDEGTEIEANGFHINNGDLLFYNKSGANIVAYSTGSWHSVKEISDEQEAKVQTS